jgi:hypothetical protein
MIVRDETDDFAPHWRGKIRVMTMFIQTLRDAIS